MSKSQQRVALIASHLSASHNNATRKLTTTTTTAAAAAVKKAYRDRQDYKYFLPIQTRYIRKFINKSSGSLIKSKLFYF